jgi:hypothetical protein
MYAKTNGLRNRMSWVILNRIGDLSCFGEEALELVTTYEHDKERLDVYSSSDIKILRLQQRVGSDCETNYLFIFASQYIWVPPEADAYLALFWPVIITCDNDVYVRDDVLLSRENANKNKIIINCNYFSGDYFFHFGHFLRDIAGLLLFLSERISVQVDPVLSGRLTGHYYLGTSIKSFHADILSAFDIKADLLLSQFSRYLTFSNEYYYTNRLSITWSSFQGLLLVPTHDWAPSYLLRRSKEHESIGKMLMLSSSMDKSLAKEAIPDHVGLIRLRGCLITRRDLPHNKKKRWENDADILELRTRIRIENRGILEVSYHLLEHEKYDPLDRAREILRYDFVVGSGSSAMYPSLLFTNRLHLIVLPRRPTRAEQRKSPLADFKVFGSDHALFIFPSCDNKDTSHIWQSEFYYSTKEFEAGIITSLLMTKNIHIRNMLSHEKPSG